MSRESLYKIATETSLALVAHLLHEPHSVGDARLFTGGRLHLWPGWARLGDEDRARVSRFLRWRPEHLAEDVVLRKRLREVLDDGIRFRWLNRDTSDEFSSTFEVAAGKPPAQLVDELLAKLERRRAARVGTVATSPDEVVQLRARKRHYSIPGAHVPDPSIPESLLTTPPVSVSLDRERLMRLASQLDELGVDRIPHREVLGSLFSQLQVAEGEAMPSAMNLIAGPTQLFVAPTGRGKSVLARLLAIDVARSGVPVAFVVPDIKTVLAEAQRIESYAGALGLHLRVGILNGLEQTFHKLADVLANPPSHDPSGDWTLRRLGYSCRLGAFADSDHTPDGQEPCSKLVQKLGTRKRAVGCPFQGTCSKFDAHRDAMSADILVVNHWAFVMGLMPIDVDVAGVTRHRMPIAELVLRRAGLVLIDEIDQLQGAVIQRGTGSLQLTSKHKMSPLHELFEDLERRRAAGELPGDVRLERLRRHMLLVRWLSEELADQINRGDVNWPHRDKLRISHGRDSELAKKLFGDGEDIHDRLDAVFGEERLDNAREERLRQVVRKWTDGQLDEDSDTQVLHAELVQALADWPRPFGRTRGQSVRVRAHVVDALILRAVLARLEQAVNHLRAQLPMLDEYGIRAAGTVRDELLGYSSWSPSPLGPLGRRPMGFSFQRHQGEAGFLSVQALAGDPHGFISGLGDEIAAAFSGTRRVVLGMSATARFPGSPRADVLAPIAFAQPDTSDATITVEAVLVNDSDGSGPVRISGVPSMRGRNTRAVRLGALLWPQVLETHLSGLREDTATHARARALLVTGSYLEARAVAAGLAHGMGNASEANRRIRFLAPTVDGSEFPPALLSRDLERFGATGADVLVAPLPVVSRGHNILAPGTAHSAISSIFVLVRPVPPAEQPEAALAHISYDARRRAARCSEVGQAIIAERRRAEQQLRFLQQSAGPFSHLPPDLRHQVLCDVLVDVAQLAGRARRGGTDVRLYLVDGAFHDELVGWAPLLAQSFAIWKSDGRLDEMIRLHGPFLHALRRFAGIEGV